MPHPKYHRDNPPPLVPHSSYGDPECCGLFLPEERGDVAGYHIQQMRRCFSAQSQPQKSTPHCSAWPWRRGCVRKPALWGGKVNVLPGFSAIEAFTCRSCGEGVQVQRRTQ